MEAEKADAIHAIYTKVQRPSIERNSWGALGPLRLIYDMGEAFPYRG